MNSSRKKLNYYNTIFKHIFFSNLYLLQYNIFEKMPIIFLILKLELQLSIVINLF